MNATKPSGSKKSLATVCFIIAAAMLLFAVAVPEAAYGAVLFGMLGGACLCSSVL